MNYLAGVLDDLDLVKRPNTEELEVLREEEGVDSQTDMTNIRKKRLADLEQDDTIELDKEKADSISKARPFRNHGLFSKAERVLTITGWSQNATCDIEIFKLADTYGLTPLLAVLNDPESKADGTLE